MDVIGIEKACVLHGLAKDGALLVREGVPMLWVDAMDALDYCRDLLRFRGYEVVACHVVVRAQ